MNDNYEGVWKVLELHNKFVQADMDRWLEVEVFTLQWWIIVGFADARLKSGHGKLGEYQV
jgi:hypothetical protein